MARKFVVATDNLSADEEKAFAQALASPIGWWHWLPNTWLVIDRGDQLTASEIRSRLHKITNTKRCLILEVDQKTWAALVFTGDPKGNLTQWIRDEWDRE